MKMSLLRPLACTAALAAAGVGLLGAGTASATTTPPPAPITQFDSAHGGDGYVMVSGWSYDPSNPAASNDVAIYRNAGTVKMAQFAADQPSVTVDNLRHITGNHKFVKSIGAPAGTYTVCVVGTKIGQPPVVTILDKCISVTVS